MQIAVANSRMDKVWKNIEISWEEFLERVSTTRRTIESVEEYKNLSKVKQDGIKDVGGFVGGRLKDGKRKNGYVEYRSMLTLDMDYAKAGVWDEIKMFFNFTCCLYSTHKHTQEKPRLRLIIPLLRNVSADEYTAVARKVAEDIGIEMFDDTTYQATRLMYWPSTSSDGEFIFGKQEGSILDPDKVLSRYKDWRDTSKWPVSSRQMTVVKSSISKQADPLTKAGVVGAFCRTYSIEEAIEKFLSDIYKPSVMEGRYDYAPADSSAGVLVYDNKFSFSHHATDPSCGKLCNSFDLVRIHKFGDMEEDESYKAMQEFCMNDSEVKKQVVEKRKEQAMEDFEDDWYSKLELNKNGDIKDTLSNIVRILKCDENLKEIAYNEHKCALDVKGDLPWEQIKSGWNDSDLASLKVYFDKTYGIWSPSKIREGLVAVAAQRSFHPIKEYLKFLPKWDEVERLDRLLIDYLGAEDNEYTRAVIRKTLVAAITRIYHPGTKFDTVLILNGPQGIGKSTLFSKLGSRWFSDSLTITDMRDKAAAEKLQGYWILELGELAGIKKTDVETVKGFVTRTDDKYRASYGVNVESHPRQCIVVGTTNSESGFLRDITGNRRFWPVRVSGEGIKKAWDLNDIDQIWAEAMLLYRKGEKLVLEGNAEVIAVAEQAGAMETDDREGLVRDYLDKLLPESWNQMDLYDRRNFLNDREFGTTNAGSVPRQKVCTMEIWCECFGKEGSSMKKADAYELNAIMSRIEGWKKYDGSKTGKMKFPIYGVQYAYVKSC
jgi:putative DNA primase/helicase